MYGLPGETLASWKEDLKQALALHPEHISAYHLIYEEGTTLWQLREQHKLEEADEDLSVSLFGTLIDSLTAAGYEHYEISNFCLPGFHSRHNSSYWTEKKYLGCGPSAHSYNGTSRQWNVASLNEYIRGISNGNPTFEVEELDLYTRYNDFCHYPHTYTMGNATAQTQETIWRRTVQILPAYGHPAFTTRNTGNKKRYAETDA